MGVGAAHVGRVGRNGRAQTRDDRAARSLRRMRRQEAEEGGAEERVRGAAGASGGELHATMGLVAELQELRDVYSRFLAMEEAERVDYVKTRLHQKASIAAPFSLSPEGVGNFYEAMELVRRIVEAILLCHCFGPNEDVGKGISIGATTGAAANFMRNAFTDATVSDGYGFRIVSGFQTSCLWELTSVCSPVFP